MLHFNCDYMEGCCPEILQRLSETNMEQTGGYGDDPYSLSCKEKIREQFGCPNSEIYLMVGGTHTNSTVIDSIMWSYQGVLAVSTAHINIHEAGIVESHGHKILTLPSHNGKMWASDIRDWLVAFYGDQSHQHMVEPGMVYITFPTELGTSYTKKEMQEIHEVCKEYKLPLYVDGARLGYGLAAYDCDITMKDLPQLCDAFYIGGTKVGALFGEAIVLVNPGMTKNFFTQTKRHGALLAKGRLLGVQFDTFFTDNLYMRLSRHAIDCAERLREILAEKGLQPYVHSRTNQSFYVMTDEQIEKWQPYVTFDLWDRLPDGRHIARFCTSWATMPEHVEAMNELPNLRLSESRAKLA